MQTKIAMIICPNKMPSNLLSAKLLPSWRLHLMFYTLAWREILGRAVFIELASKTFPSHFFFAWLGRFIISIRNCLDISGLFFTKQPTSADNERVQTHKHVQQTQAEGGRLNWKTLARLIIHGRSCIENKASILRLLVNQCRFIKRKNEVNFGASGR